jgi:uncharacterized protein YjbI with pentapeptide repeats
MVFNIDFLFESNYLVAFLAGAFLAGAFLAGAFLAGAFLAGAFLAGAFLAGAFLAGAFIDARNASAETLSNIDSFGVIPNQILNLFNMIPLFLLIF